MSFGQAYYVCFDHANRAEKNAEYFSFVINWSDNTTTSCANIEALHNASGLYGKYVKSVTIGSSGGNSYITEIPTELGDLSEISYKTSNVEFNQHFQQYKLQPYLDLQKIAGSYCETEILTFNCNYCHACDGISNFEFPIAVSFSQGSKNYDYGEFNQTKIQIEYKTLSSVIDLTIPFDIIYHIKIKSKGKESIISAKSSIEPIYPYVKVEESDFLVSDNKFYYPKLIGSQKITFYNINTALRDQLNEDSKEPYDLGIYYGLYNITITENKRCSVTKSFVYPELTYNYVNNTKEKEKQYNFWYEGDRANAVELTLYEYKKSTKLVNIGLPQIKISPNMGLVSDTTGFILCQDGENSEKVTKVEITKKFYTISTTDTLSKITITGNKDFIPVTKSVELKSYPKITDVKTETEDAVCYYDTAIVKVSGMKGGLSNGYKFMLKKGEKEFWSEDSIIKIPATAFGGNEQEVKLYVYDKEDISEDTGREKRAFSTNINFNYGETLDIKNWQVADLKCFEDNTGEISISDWTPKNEDIKFEVWKSENKISDSQITENLAAGDYNLKIVDGNDCVNDSFQVTVNQPDKLQTSVKSFETPLCYGYADGKISTTTIGGTGDYTFLWNNGATTSDIENLNAGIYQLTVTDENKCQTSVSQVLTEPKELKNSLQSSYTICKNGELKIDEGDLKSEEFHYFWHLPNGNIHEDRVLVVTSDMPEGDYIMYTSDSKGCFTKDTTNIKFADNELNIKFLAPTYSYLGDTVVLAEDSEIFTDYTWSYQFNNDMFEDITSSIYDTPKNQTFLKTWAYGTDTITMYANDGHCNASFSKEVNILNEQQSDYSNYEAPSAGIFTRLAIGPSPNDGNFTLYANLTEEAALDVFILDLQTALKIPLKYDSKFESDHYAIPVHGLNLLKGIYALFVTANSDTKYIKFTIK